MTNGKFINKSLFYLRVLFHFSDPEWNKIPKTEREKMGIVFEEDGEFWYDFFF